MHKNWAEFLSGYSAPVTELRGVAPELMKSFGAVAHAAHEPGAVDAKTKELAALAIAVALRCDPCIGYHARAALRNGATRQEVGEFIGIAVEFCGGPAVYYAAAALEAYDQFAAKAAAPR